MSIQAFQNLLLPLGLKLLYSPSWTDSASIRKAPVDIPVDWSTSPPTASAGAVSLSHSPLGGAVLTSDSRGSVGVDVEDASRLNAKVVSRVSSPEEISKAPRPEYLWPAKEAAFKASHPENRDIVLSQIHIDKWTLGAQGIWQFEARHEPTDRAFAGYLLDTGTLLIAAVFPVSK
jgi:4'-phosphopantetheinyl transferase EntD